jgi:hypothetical protein
MVILTNVMYLQVLHKQSSTMSCMTARLAGARTVLPEQE